MYSNQTRFTFIQYCKARLHYIPTGIYMPSDEKTFKDLLSQVASLLNDSVFPPSWPDVAQIGELSEPLILEYIFKLAGSSHDQELPYDAIEYLLHCTLLELMIQIRHGQSGPKKEWEKLQFILISALNSEQGNDELFTVILDHISNHNLPLDQETLDAIISWQQSKFEPTIEEASLSQEEINKELISHLEQLHISSEFEFYQLFADHHDTFGDNVESSPGVVCCQCFCRAHQ